MKIDLLRRESSLLSPNDVCAEIHALSVVEFTYTPRLTITVDLNRSGGTISDTGRGIALVPDRGDTISHAERAQWCDTDIEPWTLGVEILERNRPNFLSLQTIGHAIHHNTGRLTTSNN